MEALLFGLTILAHPAVALPYAYGLPSNWIGRRSTIEIARTQAVTNLRRTTGLGPISSRALDISRGGPSQYLRQLGGGAGYAIDVQFGQRSYLLMLDTGSADCWLPSTDFQCVQPNEQTRTLDRVAQEVYGIGDTCGTAFSGGTIPNEHMRISYGSMRLLTGSMGYESVTVAGINVPNQRAALASYGFWHGNNVTSGIIGFADPTITAAYAGAIPRLDTPSLKLPPNIPYNPFIFNAIEQGSIGPMFGVALDRYTTSTNGLAGGQLSLGGAPNVPHGRWASTPQRIIKLDEHMPDAAATQYSFYTLIPDGFTIVNDYGTILRKRSKAATHISYQEATANAKGIRLEPRTTATTFPMIVDSGTTVTYVPPDIVAAFANAFQPPPQLQQPPGPAQPGQQGGIYATNCNARAPYFAIRIAGTDFWMRTEDVLMQGEMGYDQQTGLCALGVQPAPQAPYVLGTTFMRGVVVVHDLGNRMLHFAQRTD